MHRIIVGYGSIKSALDALHMRSTKFSIYPNTYNPVLQPNLYSQVSSTGRSLVSYLL